MIIPERVKETDNIEEAISQIHSEMEACGEDEDILRAGGSLDVIDWKEEDRAEWLKSTLEMDAELNKELKEIEAYEKKVKEND